MSVPPVHPASSGSYENTPPQSPQSGGKVVTVAREVLERPVQKNKSRCWKCKKKVGLMPQECRCGYIFCLKHRYSFSHDCDYDHQKEERERLAELNPPVIADKMKDRI